MPNLEFSAHARHMLVERGIAEEWVRRARHSPDRTVEDPSGNTHYMKAIPEHGGRVRRVIVNATAGPERVVTVFFDRRLRSKE